MLNRKTQNKSNAEKLVIKQPPATSSNRPNVTADNS